MTLETRDDGHGKYSKKIVECPFCGEEIKDGSAFRYHMPCDGVDA